MYRFILISLLIVFGYGWAYAQGIPSGLRDEINHQTNSSDGVYTIELSQKEYVVGIEHKDIKFIKRVVFPNGVRENIDMHIVNMIEEAYASHLLKIDNPRFEAISVLEGEWDFLEGLKDGDCEISISFQNDSFYLISISNSGDVLSLLCPIDYQLFNNGSRTDIENSFIKGLLLFNANENRTAPIINSEDLQIIGDNIFVLPGEKYIHGSINRNAYISSNNDNLEFIVNPMQPIATISNMIVIGVGFKATVNLSILRHEYGEKTTVLVPLEQFLQFCIVSGCQVFWGVNEYKDNILSGTIVCRNEKQGYEHIVRLQCNTSDLGTESFTLDGRASLFVPTTNLQRQSLNN